MKKYLIYLLITPILLSSCFQPFYDRIIGHAVIIDNFKDKTPLEGVYIEVEHTEDEGYNYYVIGTAVTDSSGYFELDLKFESAIFNIDAWSHACVYSDTNYTDTLGCFSFQYADDTYRYQTIHLDTFSLSHNIWLKPRIKNIGDYSPDEIKIDFNHVKLIDPSKEIINYPGPIIDGQTFDAVEVEMNMLIQHWITYGSRHFAYAQLFENSEKIGYGNFTLEEIKHTNEGDTLYIDFEVRE